MFIDEIFEDYLVAKKESLARAMEQVCAVKLADKKDWNFTTIKQIENGYQLFRKKHQEFPEWGFRSYVEERSPELAFRLGWAS